MLAIHGVNVAALPEGLGEGNFRVELVTAPDEEALEHKIETTAALRRAVLVLTSAPKRRTVPEEFYKPYPPELVEETYCYAVFSSSPAIGDRNALGD
jgi:hypothetical protein